MLKKLILQSLPKKLECFRCFMQKDEFFIFSGVLGDRFLQPAGVLHRHEAGGDPPTQGLGSWQCHLSGINSSWQCYLPGINSSWQCHLSGISSSWQCHLSGISSWQCCLLGTYIQLLTTSSARYIKLLTVFLLTVFLITYNFRFRIPGHPIQSGFHSRRIYGRIRIK